ncbi:MAG: SMC-Scp complex subunit ScpB [candidate division KSB1 bacterium]|nr:SMC-Scp complex subunit ScpB [candidate division KSB1 bacterium]
MELEELKPIVEAIIFASDEPVSVQRIVQLIEGSTAKRVQEAIDSLNREYAVTGRSFFLAKLAGGYQMVTRPEYGPWVRRVLKASSRPRLSRAALETLAIIAFKQPVSRVEIDFIRGVNSDGVLKSLLERNLITVAGRADTVGRPLLYKTTQEFLRYFGLNSLDELPRPKEIDELLASGEGATILADAESAARRAGGQDE